MKNHKTVVGILIVMLVAITCFPVFAQEKIVIKIGYPDAAQTKIGEYVMPFPTYAAMLTFKNALEASTGGRAEVQIFAGGALGDHRSNLEQIITGNLQMAGPSDGPLSNFFKDIQIFSIPYLFEDALHYYSVMESDFAKKFFNDMAKQSGLRVISVFENGGFRNFSNSAHPIKTAADLKGLKIRTMEITAHMEIVKALGGFPTPIAWTELYSALQTGVVDGQENSPLTTLLGSIQEVQKYYTLDGHILSPAFLVVGEDFYQGLPEDIRIAFDAAAIKATMAARGILRISDSLALQALIDDPKIEVYKPTSEELSTFKVAQKPVIEFLKANINPDFVDGIIEESNKYSVKEMIANTKSAPTSSATANVKGSSGFSVQTIISVVVAIIISVFITSFVMRKKKSTKA